MSRKHVRRIHQPPPSEKPPPPAWRWLVPRKTGPAEAHGAFAGAARTACTAYVTDGAIYPPAPMVPKCPVCLDLEPSRGAPDA